LERNGRSSADATIVLGTATLADQLRAEAKEAVNDLKTQSYLYPSTDR
jgi:cation transport ATPase